MSPWPDTGIALLFTFYFLLLLPIIILGSGITTDD
jgi:hypothetical protein